MKPNGQNCSPEIAELRLNVLASTHLQPAFALPQFLHTVARYSFPVQVNFTSQGTYVPVHAHVGLTILSFCVDPVVLHPNANLT